MRLVQSIATISISSLAAALVWLAPGPTTVRSAIHRGETRSIRLPFPAGHTVVVTVDQFEIDLALSARLPDGRTVEGGDRGPYGRETLLFLTDVAGSYEVNIHASASGSKRGEFLLQVTQDRPMRPEDLSGLRAQSLFAEATALESKVTAENQQKQIRLYGEAAALYRAAHLTEAEATARNHQARILDRSGQRDAAYESYRQALRLREQTNDWCGRLETLRQIGRLSGHLRQQFPFVPTDLQLLDLWKKLGDRRGIAQSMSAVSSFYLRAKVDQPQALRWAEKGVLLARQIQDPVLEARGLESLINVQRDQGQYDLALENAQRVLTVMEDTGDERGRTAALGAIAYVLIKSGRYAESIPLLEEQLRLYKMQGDPTSVAASWSVLADMQTRVGKEAAARASAEQAEQAMFGVADRYNSPKWRAAYIDTLSIGETHASLLISAGKVPESLRIFERLRTRAYGIEKDYTPDRIVAELDSDTVLLETCLSPDRMILWVVDHNGIRAFTTWDATRLASLASKVWGCYATRRTCSEDARELSRTLLGRALPYLRAQRILISADGILSYFPWSALPDPTRDDDVPLLVNHEIVQIPSFSAMEWLRRQSPPGPLQLTVLADPVFDARDARLRQPGAAPPRLDPDLVRAIENSGLQLQHGALPRLSYSTAELDAIVDSLPRDCPRRIFTGLDAQREILTRPLPPGTVLHLSTHGFINEDDPDLSGLAFSLVDTNGQPRDGYFRLRELYSHHLPARLVVLSACQTACGRQYYGQGAYSLSAAFLRSGARSVVASSWRVNDESAAELMRRFYRHLMSSPQIKVGAALRAAQLDLLSNPRWNHPYHWAAFSAFGDWR